MVPDASFTSYYGRPVVKASPWTVDIPAYLYLGGLAGASSLLAAGAQASDRPGLRRATRLTALGAITGSFAALAHDLGRPGRFINMLRVVKVTSPMSVGTWFLTVYGPAAGVTGAAELLPLLPERLQHSVIGRLGAASATPAGVVAAAMGPLVASYTAVLLSDTASPAWHEAHRELPFVFVGSAASAAGGMAMLTSPLTETAPARALAVGGAALELAAEHRMEQSMGMVAEALHEGRAGRFLRVAKVLTASGATLALLSRRSRALTAVAGAMLTAGSACTRFAVFDAGQESAKDPRYTVVPQRERLDRDGPTKG